MRLITKNEDELWKMRNENLSTAKGKLSKSCKRKELEKSGHERYLGTLYGTQSINSELTLFSMIFLLHPHAKATA